MKDKRTRRHILIVEDEPDFAALMQAFLHEGNFSTSVAHDGENAVELLFENKPDLITLDIQMPRKTGLLFYRQVKNMDRYRDVPVVVVTGLTRDDPDMASFIRSFLEVEKIPSPDAYLEKPVNKEKLMSTVEEAFRKRSEAVPRSCTG